jgi:hypothetical protein
MKRLLYLFAFVASAVAVAACGGGNSNPPAPGPTCSPPNGTQSVLVYPAPGATGVVNTTGQVVIGSTAALPVNQTGQNWQIVIVDAVFPGGVAMPGTLQSASPPFPSPNTIPSFANPQYQTQSFNTPFAANQNVSVYVNNTSSNCTPLLIGSFGT